jgi:hypothetical protein
VPPCSPCWVLHALCCSGGTFIAEGCARATAARKSKDGARCVDCRLRLRLLKGREYAVNGGMICQVCYNRSRREAESAAAGAPLQTTPRRSVVPAVARLSPEQHSQLRDTVTAATGLGQQGRSRSAPEVAQTLLVLDAVRQVAPSFDAAVKLTAHAVQASPAKVRADAKRYERDGELAALQSPAKRLTRNDPLHALFGVGGPSLQVESVIYQCVEEASSENRYISLRTIRAAIFAATTVEVARSTLHRWMAQLRLRWGEKKLSGLKPSYTFALIRRYLLRYSSFLEEQRRGECVLVWMDESYIHQGYCSAYSWFVDRGDPVTPNRVRGSEKGKRLIIIHAMTKDGMLDSLQAGQEASDNLGERCASAGLVTAKLSADGVEPEDYHDTMNGEKFLSWMRTRLMPAFEAKYRRKKMVSRPGPAADGRAQIRFAVHTAVRVVAAAHRVGVGAREAPGGHAGQDGTNTPAVRGANQDRPAIGHVAAVPEHHRAHAQAHG